MIETLISLIFFLALPAVFISLVISVIGVLKNKSWLVILGAILFIPFAYYLNGSPGLRGFAILLPLFQMGAAAAVHENNKLWAWLLLAPSFLMSFWVLGAVLFYQFR